MSGYTKKIIWGTPGVQVFIYRDGIGIMEETFYPWFGMDNAFIRAHRWAADFIESLEEYEVTQ